MEPVAQRRSFYAIRSSFGISIYRCLGKPEKVISRLRVPKGVNSPLYTSDGLNTGTVLEQISYRNAELMGILSPRIIWEKAQIKIPYTVPSIKLTRGQWQSALKLIKELTNE